ncbi:MAG TPA: endolytic transglycosylase MltG [Nitrospirota bacterium]
MKLRASPYLKAAMLAAAVALAAVTAYAGFFLVSVPSAAKEFKEVLIPAGSSYRAVATLLEEQGIITNKETFIILGKLTGATKIIRAGFYSLNTSMRPLEVLEYIKQGRIIEFQVVLPEGITIRKTASLLQDNGLVDAAEFLTMANDPDYVHSLGIDADTLEGYMFPATYYFPKGITTDGIIRRLVSKYKDVFSDDLKARAAEVGMSEHEVVTLASLVEREAMLDKERLLISAVFHNRLKRGIRLQCDPTVIYALEKKGGWNGNITKADLRMKDPYNTYVYPGLPPGPIANPGKPSIIAALYPADVDYIFFVSKNDGTHFFSGSLAEHNLAVREFQKSLLDETKETGAVLEEAPGARPAQPVEAKKAR